MKMYHLSVWKGKTRSRYKFEAKANAATVYKVQKVVSTFRPMVKIETDFFISYHKINISLKCLFFLSKQYVQICRSYKTSLS